MEPNELLTPDEVAGKLRVSRYRVYELAREGRLPGVVRLGRQVRIEAEALSEFISGGGEALPGGWRRERSDSD